MKESRPPQPLTRPAVSVKSKDPLQEALAQKQKNQGVREKYGLTGRKLPFRP